MLYVMQSLAQTAGPERNGTERGIGTEIHQWYAGDRTAKVASVL